MAPASQCLPAAFSLVLMPIPNFGPLPGQEALTHCLLHSSLPRHRSQPCCQLLMFPTHRSPHVHPPAGCRCPLLGSFPSSLLPADTSYCCSGSHTLSTNCSPPHVFSVHRYTDLVTVILFISKMVNEFGLSLPPLCVQLSGLSEVRIKQSFRHFCSLCTRAKCLKRCKIVKNQCGVFLPHSRLPISFKKINRLQFALILINLHKLRQIH